MEVARRPTTTGRISWRSVSDGLVPQVSIDGQAAADPSYTQDSTVYYVRHTIHFSTDQVTIHFAPPSNSGLGLVECLAM